MAHFDISERNFPAGLRRTSPDVAVPANSTHIQATLVSSEWAAKAGTGTVSLGFEMSTDGGATWAILTGFTVPIGYLNKGTLMPSCGATVGGNGMSGVVRMYATASTAIRLGASVDITAGT